VSNPIASISGWAKASAAAVMPKMPRARSLRAAASWSLVSTL
jgi:hypothetical protein